MSNIKDLFSGKKTDKLLENSTAKDVGSSVESADYLRSNIKDKKRFIPHVDFTSASNFAIYGSAEKYYEDAYNYIRKQYPYDGSLKEKINWSLSGSYLDRYIFENDYPRTTGYINFGKSYGTLTQQTKGYDSSTKNEWIYFKGYNVNYSLNAETNPELTLQFDNLNIYNTASQGLSNLELEGSGGLGVEFWLNKNSFDSSIESRRQVVVDVWNSGSWGTADGISSSYGRFRVEISGTEVGNKLHPNFHVELLSGSTGFSSEYVVKGSTSDNVPTIIMSGSKLTGSWNHFALTFQNTGSQMVGRLYTNGALTYTCVSGTTMGTVTGSMLGQVGSLVAKVSSSGPARGYGKLSASLDEFRFWKTRRTSEQIGKYWFTQVGGGTNTDVTLAATASTKYSYENPADLGVYYKFNEGIINTSSINSQDAVVLDYAGRVTNGQWTGYSVTSRNTGSAIVSASAASSEFKDPILYSSHPLVSSSLNEKKDVGKWHDETNNSSIYGSLPEWITSDDQNKGNSALRNLTQIMASYFDTLYLQTQAVPGLKNKDYISGSDKPFPFVNRFIDASGFLTSEIFSKATDLEYLDARNDTKKFGDKVNELKNLIYKNIYNNLVYIYKTKGTEKSFRNLIRSFGVDKELINIKLYGDEVTYKLQDNYDNSTVRKRYVDFYAADKLNAVVYQQTASGNSYSRGFISSSGEVQYRGNTYELESYFPKDIQKGISSYFNAAFLTASIYGCHTSGTAGSTAWGTPDYGQFQVQSVRTDTSRPAAFFQLTCSNDGEGLIPKLTSSVFQDVYDGSRWNFAVRIKPKKYPLADGVSGSTTGQYDVEFSGYNYVLDISNNSFLVTSSISAADAQEFLRAKKRFFVGAHRTNTTGTVLQKSNVKSTSLRVWMDYLTSSVLQAHAKDVTNFGSLNPYRDAYITELGAALGSKNVKSIPQLETLILNWDFATVTSSDAGGNFTVPDVSIASSGTNDYSTRWGWLGPIGQHQHTGYGFGFPANATGSIDRRYVHTLELQPPETINSSDMISLVDEEQNKLFSRDTRPESYFFAFEKSMYNTISKEMLDIFATIVDFNNLIGEPVNRYRQEYKQMQKLRQLYFERLQNTLDLNKFVEYFKWIDSAISVMLQQLVPGSARFSENVRTMIESHVLERNKYWSKFPTLEMKVSDPEAGVFGINELLYSGKRGLAPIPTTATGSNCEWWHERANRDNPNITSGDSTIDSQRDKFRNANDFRTGSVPNLVVSRKTTATTTTYRGNTYALRNFTKPYRLTVDESPEIHGGSNFPRAKTVEYTHEALKFGSSEQLQIAASSIPMANGNRFDGCDDVIVPNAKNRLEAKVENNGNRFGYTSGKSEIFAPFSLFSSSAKQGYIASVATNFKSNTEIDNYHDDIYGDDKGIPAQGPFTERHVGGRQHRHINVNTGAVDTTLTRPEAWNLSLASNILTISPRTADEPRATMIRDEYAKRPVNIRNIKWGTSSAVAGNYRKDYEIVQTVGRSSNNSFLTKNGGFSPVVSSSAFISDHAGYLLPDFSKFGSTKYVFVERFSSPGSPAASGRGSLDLYAEEYSVYNELNNRNLEVRNALKKWQTNHCGQFGISPTGSPGDGTNPGQHQTNPASYDGVIAAYHKTNRNPVQSALVKSGFDRTIDWNLLDLRGGHITYDRTTATLSKSVGGSAYGEAIAVGTQKLDRSGYISAELTYIGTNNGQRFGLDKNPAAKEQNGGGAGDGPAYTLAFTTAVYVLESNVIVSTAPTTRAVGDIFRILRENENITYQKSTDKGKNFTTFYTSLQPSTTDLYPFIDLKELGTTIKNLKISNPRYDNWFIQHPIPQSELQYAWINDSYNVSQSQPLGYAAGSHDSDGLVPFSVPSGTGSITASAVQFISSSCFDPDWDPPCAEVVNFAQYWHINPAYRQDRYHYTVTGSTNTLEAASWWTTVFGQSINAFFNNVNGPYGYPSWKQIRTGETPVARNHKRNNILSIQARPAYINLPKPSGSAPGEYFNKRPDSFTNFVEPPVTFKYRPLTSELSNVSLRHTYANNKGLWTQRGLPLASPERSIAEFLETPNEKGEAQIYEKLRSSEQYRISFDNNGALLYPEVIFPREANTGLARTRARTRYAETASVINPSVIPLTASLSLGSNGIDRGPNERRTFWRDRRDERNRYLGPNWFCPADESCGLRGEDNYLSFATTISNSCGNQDGHARSVWPFGKEPIVWYPPSQSMPCGNLRVSASSVLGQNQGQDTGELNSINIMKIGGLMGGVVSSSLCNLNNFYDTPSASAYYYWLPHNGLGQAYYDTSDGYQLLWGASSGSYTIELCKGLKWTAAIDSGKNPGFDSYEAYAEDIRGLSKAWTVLPEFRISDHMSYYVEDKSMNFMAKNDKFLSLDGGNITASAVVGDAAPAEPNVRNFNRNFFKEYSFSDFQQYFGKFTDDNKLDRITLKCNAVKKLLPYKGFYPADRTTQLVSLFSGALGQYVTGGALSQSGYPYKYTGGASDVNVSKNCEQQLAMQSLLQPWFAPGILYNTIKSGISVDWPVFTGSYTTNNPYSQYLESSMTGSANVRFPFNSLLDPLSQISVSSSNEGQGGHELLFQAPTYFRGLHFYRGQYASVATAKTRRFPYAEFTSKAGLDQELRLYKSAMHNYLAEIPNFFLRNQNLKYIESLTQTQLGNVIEEGKIYVMDVFLEKTKPSNNHELVMMEDYYNGSVSGTVINNTWGNDNSASFNGKYFGPPYNPMGKGGSDVAVGDDSWGAGGAPGRYNADPAYAPVCPPYFYGKAHARLIYTGSINDRLGGSSQFWDLTKILTSMTMSFRGVDDERRSAWTKYRTWEDGTLNYEGGSAFLNMMNVTASLSIDGIKVDPEEPTNIGLNRWVIAPFMETPVLDFSSSQTPEQGYGRGMWSGYGRIPSGSKGIYFGIESPPQLFLNNPNVRDMTEWFRNTPVGESSAQTTRDARGRRHAAQVGAVTSTEHTQQVGQIADEKIISEAVVAIPFSTRQYGRNSGRARTVSAPIMGKWFFSLGSTARNARSMFTTSMRDAAVLAPTSISDMGRLMKEYIIPPHLDFVKNGSIEPFAMYIMEFTHTLSDLDLADIWQGLMPKISVNAELDTSNITHYTGPNEFFGGKKLPPSSEIRWMVFKVKKKANINYWSMTPASTDDVSYTGHPQDLNPVGLDYSYNWPYDYFSLVELAQVEVEDQFVTRPPIPTGPGGTVRATTRPATTAEVALRAANRTNVAPSASPSTSTTTPTNTGGGGGFTQGGGGTPPGGLTGA